LKIENFELADSIFIGPDKTLANQGQTAYLVFFGFLRVY